MNNDFEYQRRKFWIDAFMSNASNPEWDSTDCGAFANNAIFEFDMRFPPKPEAKIMNKKEFGSWLTNKEKR